MWIHTFPKGISAIWTHSWEDKGVHTFPKCICPKVNVIARLEYELAYYDSAVHRFNHYTTRTPWISPTLSRHFSLSFIASGRSSGLHPVSSHSCCMYVRAGRPAFAWPYAGSIGVYHLWAPPCFSSSALHVWFVLCNCHLASYPAVLLASK